MEPMPRANTYHTMFIFIPFYKLTMSTENDIGFEPDWKAVFVRDFCKVCKKREICPQQYACKDLIDFVELNEDVHNGNSSKKIRP